MKHIDKLEHKLQASIDKEIEKERKGLNENLKYAKTKTRKIISKLWEFHK